MAGQSATHERAYSSTRSVIMRLTCSRVVIQVDAAARKVRSHHRHGTPTAGKVAGSRLVVVLEQMVIRLQVWACKRAFECRSRYSQSSGPVVEYQCPES